LRKEEAKLAHKEFPKDNLLRHL